MYYEHRLAGQRDMGHSDADRGWHQGKLSKFGYGAEWQRDFERVQPGANFQLIWSGVGGENEAPTS